MDRWNRPPRVACVGLACRDHVWTVANVPPTHSRTPASSYRAEGGGPAATAAVAIARLGGEARLMALFGEDPEGASTRAELEMWGVDLQASRTPPGARSFVSSVLIDPSGERFIFPYRGELPEDPSAHHLAHLDDAGALLTDARHPLLAEAALRRARARGTPTIGDWGDLRHPQLLPLIDHLIVSEEAAREALARDGASTPSEPRAMAQAALAHLRVDPSQVVAVTLGGHGVLWSEPSGAFALPAAAVAVVETNGAGDAFHGGYAAALAAGWRVPEAMALASAVGALRCSGSGRAALPDLNTALALARTLPEPHPLPPTHRTPGGL